MFLGVSESLIWVETSEALQGMPNVPAKKSWYQYNKV
jgi:hypothetical protein